MTSLSGCAALFVAEQGAMAGKGTVGGLQSR
jgi:hypothetical protein